MLISHFCFSLDPSRGGVSSGVMATVEQLTKYGVSNQILSFGITRNQILACSQQRSKLKLIGVEYRYTVARIKNDYGLGSIRGLLKIFKNLPEPDLVVLHQIYSLSTLIGYIYAKRIGVPYVVKPHGSLTRYHESDNKLIKILAKWLLISKILQESDAIVVTCENERFDLNLSLQAKSYHIGYGALMSHSIDDGIRISHQTNQNPRILFSGRFDKKKNLPLLIKALPHILEKYPALILDIAGSGTRNEIRVLQKLISSLKLETSVQFHGWIDVSKMTELFANARMLVLPSENENFAIVVADALGAGVPCVVSKYVGTSDIIAKHHAGEVIDELTPTSVAHGVVKVLQGDEIQYRQAAFEAVEKSLDWSIIALRWKTLVTSLTYTKL